MNACWIQRLLLAIALLAAALTAPAAEVTLERYIVILNEHGGPAPDIAALGGTIEFRQAEQIVVSLPPGAAARLRQDPLVRYVQSVGGSEQREPELLGIPSEPSPGVLSPTARAAGGLKVRPMGAVTWDRGAYSYDGAGNITAVGTQSFSYDDVQRLAQATVSGTDSYTYDGFGNMLSKTVGGVPQSMPAVDPQTNRLNSTGYVYDVAGNLTSSGPWAFTYDAVGQPVSKTYSGSNQANYIYDAGGERIGVQENGWWTWSLRDEGGKVLRQYRSSVSNPTAAALWLEDFVWRNGLLLGSQRPAEMGGRRHFHLDHLGTPRLITSDSALQVSAHDYFPFGEELTPVASELANGFDREDPMKFTGHERDFAGGQGREDGNYIDYMHARYYSVMLARFFRPDPLLGSPGWPQSWNRYAYVLNSPMTRMDPSGLDDCKPGEAVPPGGCHSDVNGNLLDYGSSDDVNFFLESRQLAAEFFAARYRNTAGFANAFASDMLLNSGRYDDDDDDYALGQIGGDLFATFVGGLEIQAGVNGNVGGLLADVTVEGAAVGAVAHVVSTAVAIHGGAVTAIGSAHAMSGIKQRKEGKHGQFRGRESKRANDSVVDRVCRLLNLTKDQRRRLHDAISGLSLTFDEIVREAKTMFNL